MDNEKSLTLGGVKYRLLLKKEDIMNRVAEIGACLTREYAGRRPLFLCVLNGSFVFAADLVRAYDGDCDVSFIKLSSYEGDTSTGKVTTAIGLPDGLKGRDIVVVEDIVDTGLTMAGLLKMLEAKGPKSISVATLFLKPSKLKYDVKVDYVAFEIPDNFIIGYGLDFDGLYRNLPDVYTK